VTPLLGWTGDGPVYAGAPGRARSPPAGPGTAPLLHRWLPTHDAGVFASRAAAALALLLLGCATIRSGRLPSSGREWRERVSEHFVLRTDLSDGDAAELVNQLEMLRSAVLAGLFMESRDPPGRVEVIAFESDEEYRAFAPVHASAYYLRNPGGPPRIVLPGGLGAMQRVALAHELTHHLSACLFAIHVTWLSEGLAVYMEALADVPLGPRLRLGQLPEGRLPRAFQRRITVRELFAWGEAPLGGLWLDYYVSSVLLVRHLVDRYPAEFGAMLARLARGEAPDDALGAVLPQFDPRRPGSLESLDKEVASRVASGLGFPGREIEVRGGVAYLVQPMPPAEVAALRLTLWSIGPAKEERALRAELGEALRHDPAHPIALQVQARLDGADPLPLARASVAAHAADPRSWTFLAASLPGRERAAEREAAYRRAAELAPENPAALTNLARELVAEERQGEALPVARRAVALAPWSPQAAQVQAEALAGAGLCREATVALRRAIQLLTDRGSEPERAPLRKQLEEWERGCGTAPGAAPQAGG
jgi:hypothetical protein